jgi:hypothetical protein
MALYYVDGNDLTNIADAIREKTGSNEMLSLDEMVAEIEGISNSNKDDEDMIISRSSKFTSYYNDRVTTIGSYAFLSCDNLKTVNFPGVTTILSSAFASCSSLTSVSFPAATFISNGAFAKCFSLTTVSFPAATTIGSSAFTGCRSLETISFPVATTISSHAFMNCSNLTTVNFPAATTICNVAFSSCHNLATASFPAATNIGYSVFSYCYNLKSLYLTGSSVCKLSTSNTFLSTPIGGYSTSAGTYGSIYVPQSLLTSYQTATNWTYFSSRFVGI